MQPQMMTFLAPLLLTVAVSDAAAVPPDQRREQDAALAARREGRTLPLSEIQRRVVPTVKGAKYLGFDFDSATAVYTLKFLRDGAMIWVMVDGRSGNIIGRSR